MSKSGRMGKTVMSKLDIEPATYRSRVHRTPNEATKSYAAKTGQGEPYCGSLTPPLGTKSSLCFWHDSIL